MVMPERDGSRASGTAILLSLIPIIKFFNNRQEFVGIDDLLTVIG